MKKQTILFVIITIIIVSVIISTQTKVPKQACFQETCFQLEIAQTPEARIQGLMFRDYLLENSGMLFIFQKPQIHNFWMKNTLIPLDIIWLDKNSKVIYIQTLQPCQEQTCPSYGPNQDSKYVLELNAGTAEKINLKIGDKIGF